MRNMTILLFFKKNPKDPQEAGKISGWLLLAAITLFLISAFLIHDPFRWWGWALSTWLLLDSTMYQGWIRGYRALEAEMIRAVVEMETKNALTEGQDPA